MAFIELKNQIKLGDYEKPFFVAEMNSSHNGKMELALHMIDEAVNAGCDAIKFQSWSADTLYSESYYKENPIAKKVVSKFALTPKQLKELAQYTKEKNVIFSSTPYSISEVDFLVEECDAEYIKIASMDLNNLPFLSYIGKKQLPVILSTGMGTLDEIRRAVNTIEETGNTNICILHCVSVYPIDVAQVNLNNILMLRETFPEYPIGYSDHTTGTEAACGAIALGACMIEKHFTLNNNKIGLDNQMATEPKEMKALIDCCMKVHSAMGVKERILTNAENEQKEKMRRSIVASQDIISGESLTIEMLDAKRTGKVGVSPDEYSFFIGKTALHDIKKDDMILKEDVK